MVDPADTSADGPRVAIVTGGAGGLGDAIVDRFVADGLHVAVADRVASERDDVLALVVDLTDLVGVERLA
jgi:NAD(P)-dependent dehydrogenase (short-subunit alcohol dehydrogenase family)